MPRQACSCCECSWLATQLAHVARMAILHRRTIGTWYTRARRAMKWATDRRHDARLAAQGNDGKARLVDEISSLIGGFKVALSWYNLALMMVGILLGVIIGVLPGLGGANGVAILLPLTFTMPPTSAIIMLSCIYWGALFGGAITSILFNIPGEPWSVATTFDGHPMAQQGQADEALTAAFTSSFVGALVAVILITFLAPADRQVRAAVRAGRVLLGVLPDVRQLRRAWARARPSRCWPPCAWASRSARSASTR